MRCCRCFIRDSELNQHHIQRKSEGGSNSGDNLVFLCVDCHREWHQHYEDHVEFRWWLQNVLPPRSIPILGKYPELMALKAPELHSRLTEFFSIRDELETLVEEQEKKDQETTSRWMRILAPFIPSIELRGFTRAIRRKFN